MSSLRAAFALAFVVALLFAASPSARAGPAIGPGAIAAIVRDVDGHPVAGALVAAEGPVSREASTSDTGIVTLLALPLGSYSVRVTRSGFEPYGTLVTLARDRTGPMFLNVRIAPATFSNLRGAVAQSIITLLPVDVIVSHALSRDADVNIVPLRGAGGAAPTLLGTSPTETRVELDGIPIAGGSAALAALRFRDALALDDVELVRGPALASSSLRDAIGGIINYRTPEISTSMPGAGASFGYNSTFGAFQQARAQRTFGKLGLLADVVTGGGENRSQVLKFRYALSSAASIAYAQYGSQSVASFGSSNVTSNAPAFAADVRAMLGTGSFEARAFGSASTASNVIGTAPATTLEDARSRGLQLGYAIPLGDNSLSFGFDRRTERTVDASGTTLAQMFSTVSARADIRLSSTSRLEIGDAYAGGTQMPRRHDPSFAFALHPDALTTVRASLGSAYATLPPSLFSHGSTAAALARPETSFGYRLSVDRALRDGDRAWSSLYVLRRFNRFARWSSARSIGAEIGYERAALPGRLGGLAYLQLQRSLAYGTLQPAQRDAEIATPLDPRVQLGNDPYSKARLSLAYGTAGAEFRIGTTLFGANNALAPHAVALGDASVRFEFAHAVDVRFGIENLFGQPVRDPLLVPFFAPREYTVTIGSVGGF